MDAIELHAFNGRTGAHLRRLATSSSVKRWPPHSLLKETSVARGT